MFFKLGSICYPNWILKMLWPYKFFHFLPSFKTFVLFWENGLTWYVTSPSIPKLLNWLRLHIGPWTEHNFFVAFHFFVLCFLHENAPQIQKNFLLKSFFPKNSWMKFCPSSLTFYKRSTFSWGCTSQVHKSRFDVMFSGHNLQITVALTVKIFSLNRIQCLIILIPPAVVYVKNPK